MITTWATPPNQTHLHLLGTNWLGVKALDWFRARLLSAVYESFQHNLPVWPPVIDPACF